MEQTLEDVECIFVDDGSYDNSIQILESAIRKYPKRIEHTKIIRHGINKGLPAARNSGLTEASGKYIFHCDGDDFIDPDMLEKMYRKAEDVSADMVWCDWWLSFENSERYMVQPKASTWDAALRSMLCGTMKYNVWNKLARRELYDGIRFPEGRSMGEDMTMIKIASKARKVTYVSEALYHYRRTNTEALTQNYTDRKLQEIKDNTKDTIEYLRANCDLENQEREIRRFCLNVKLPFLFTGNRKDIARWREWFPEANSEIIGNKQQALRTRLIQWCAAHNMSVMVKLYYILVYKTIYGLHYR